MVALADALDTYTSLRMGGYAPSTWKAHRSLLARLRRWVEQMAGDGVALADVDCHMLARYTDGLRPPRYTAATFNNYMQYLAQFFGFCRAEGWLTEDPLRHVRPARVAHRDRLHLTPGEMAEIIETAAPRDRIALAIGVNTGLRAGDLFALRVSDADLESDLLQVWISKTQTEDHVPITADLNDELTRWLTHYAAVTAVAGGSLSPDCRLVPPEHWTPLNVHEPNGDGQVAYRPDGLVRHPERIVHRALERLGYATYGEGFHTLRRSAARHVHTLALANGSGDAAIRLAQAFLGHRSQATTERYLGLSPERVARDRLLRGQPFLAGAWTGTPPRDTPCIPRKVVSLANHLGI